MKSINTVVVPDSLCMSLVNAPFSLSFGDTADQLVN